MKRLNAAVGSLNLGMPQHAWNELEDIDTKDRARPEVLKIRVEVCRALESWEMMAEAGFANRWEGVSRKRRETWIGGGRFEPTTFDYIMTKGLGSPRADLIDVPEEAGGAGD